MANHISHAAIPYPIKNARFTLPVPYLASTGVPTDPTTPDTEVSIDGAAFADCAEEVTTISGSNGFGWITLSGAETNGSLIVLAAKVASGPNTTLASIMPRVLAAVGSGTLSAGSAGGGTLGTLLAYDVTGCFLRTTGGTGGGGTGGANNQARKIVTYVTTTGAFTVSPNWETTPSTDTTYDVLLPEGVTLGMLRTLNPTTPGNTLDVTATGAAGVDWGNVENKTTTNDLTGTTIATTQKVDIETIKTRAVTCAAGVTVRADVGAAAAPGAGNGMLIGGSNAATTFAGLTTGALSCSTITASGAVAFQSTFAVTTSTALAALSCTTLTASGAVAFQSTFAVTTSTALGALSASTFSTSGTMTVNAFTCTNNFTVSGNWITTGTTTWTGAASFPAGLTSDITGTLTTVTTATNATTTDISAAALARFFTTDTTKLYADAVTGSVVKEIATHAGTAVPVDGSLLVTLADAVAHGGVPGLSTATLALKQVNVTNPDNSQVAFRLEASGTGGTAVAVIATGNGGTGAYLEALVGVQVYANSGAALSLSATDGPGLAISTSSGQTAVDISGSAAALSLVAADGPAVVVQGDGSSHDIALNGDGKIWDTANDLPVAVLLADGVAHGGSPGSSTATLALDHVQISAATGGAVGITSADAHAVAISAALDGINVTASRYGIALSTTDISLYLNSGVNGVKIDSTGAAISSSSAFDVPLSAAALASFFLTDSGTTYASAVSGSVVKEIVDNAAGGGTVDANVISVNGTTFTGPTVPSDRVMFSGVLGDQGLGDVENIVLPAGPSDNGVLIGSRLRITSGTGQYQERTIRSWVGSDKIAGIDHTNAVTASSGDAFTVLYDNSPPLDPSGSVLAIAQVSGFNSGALAQFFTLDTTKLYADAVAGSVVKEISTGGGAGADTPGTTTLLSRIGSAVTISGGKVAATLGATDYSGNTVQTGDAFARLGVAGAGLTALGDARLANLDALVSSRMATYAQPTGFLAATFPATIASTTNITAGTVTNLTNLPAITTDWLSAAGVSAAAAAKVADITLRRTMANVEASADGDALSKSSLYGTVQRAHQSAVVGTTHTVYQTDGTTVLGTWTVTASAGANPIIKSA